MYQVIEWALLLSIISSQIVWYSGLSPETPFQDLQTAARPHDIINTMAGTYSGDNNLGQLLEQVTVIGAGIGETTFGNNNLVFKGHGSTIQNLTSSSGGNLISVNANIGNATLIHYCDDAISRSQISDHENLFFDKSYLK
jgi:hypothetical protein